MDIGKIKFFIVLLILIIFIIPTTACSETGDTGDTDTTTLPSQAEDQKPKQVIDQYPYRPENADYTIIDNNGKYYLIFDDPSVYEFPPEFQISISATSTFTSMKEFIDAIQNGLDRGKKQHILLAFPKDEIGTNICDFNNMYIPVLPQGFKHSQSVSWGGEYYQFGGEGFYICFSTLEYYNEIYERSYLNFFEDEDITVTKTEQISEGVTATYYNNSSVKVRYVLQSGKKKFYVDKAYSINSSFTTISDSIPKKITMYCTEGDANYRVYINNPTQNYSDEWLLSFGAKAYTD